MYKIFIICVTLFVQNRDFLSLFVQFSAVALWGGETNMITGQLIEFHTISIVLLVLYDSLEKTSGEVFSVEHYCICTQCTPSCHVTALILSCTQLYLYSMHHLIGLSTIIGSTGQTLARNMIEREKRCFSVRQAYPYKKHIFLGLFQKFLWNS